MTFGLKGPRDPGVLRSEVRFSFCCESFAFAVNFLMNILVCAVNYLLLLWISWFVL